MNAMEDLIIARTAKTPEVSFLALDKTMTLSGRSIPENSIQFFEPLLSWTESFRRLQVKWRCMSSWSTSTRVLQVLVVAEETRTVQLFRRSVLVLRKTKYAKAGEDTPPSFSCPSSL